jgi:sugar phosphate isomerase/epimerase
MKLGIINSCFDQIGMDTVTGLEHIARIGFDVVDIFTEATTITSTEKGLIETTCRRLNLPVYSLPVVALGLVDFNVPVRSFHVERVKCFIDLAADLGARNIVLVLGEYVWQREVISAGEQWRWAIDACRTLGDYAEAKRIDIALELEPFRLSLLNSVAVLARFIAECGHPRVKANIDISHLVLSDCGPETLTVLKGRAAHVHISDCDGKVHGDLPPGRGIIKFTPYMQAIKELNIDSAVSIELEYSPDPTRIVQWVEEAYHNTASLMDLAGLRSASSI